MAFYDSTPEMSCSQELLEHGNDHLPYCSFEKPCFLCDDKYSTPDPVYCHGVLMGGIRRGKPGTIKPNYKNLASSSSPMAFYDSTPEMSCSQELLEDGNDHLPYCSFEKPCFLCDDKYSTPDPVYCHGVLMGGIRRGKPGTIKPNYKNLASSSSPMAFYDSTPEMSCSQELLEHGNDHLPYCSFEKPCFLCDDKYSTPDPVYCHGVLMGGIRRGKPGTIKPNYKNLASSSSPMAFYDSTPEMSCSQELLEHGNDHLPYCSFEKPCFLCDDKYSTPDPVYCHGVLMGGIRRGKPGTIKPNYKNLASSSSPMAFYDSTPEMSCSQELLEHGNDHLPYCSFEKPCFLCDDKYSTPDPVYCHGVLMGGIHRGKPGTIKPNYKNLASSSSPMAFYDSTPEMSCSQELLEDGNDHLPYCSFEKPCFLCDDKYSTPDPIYCHGVLMGGIRRGMHGTIKPNYKVDPTDQELLWKAPAAVADDH